jgi:VWFA-related protein
MKQPTLKPSFALAILLLLLPFHAVTVAAAAEPGPGFGDVIDVRVINLEVVVTAKGERVPSLNPVDFRLLVDGQERPIEFFTEVYQGRAVPAAADATGMQEALPALPPGEVVGTRYLVFVDDFFAIPAYRDRALRKLGEQLTFLEPEDRMALVAFDGHQVEMLSSWTRSLPQLQAAIQQASARPAYGLQRRSELRHFDTLDRSFNRGSFYGRNGLDRHRYQDSTWKISRVVSAANSALRAFARPPGRKVMLLLSGGWPSPNLDAVSAGYGSGVSGSGLVDGFDSFGYGSLGYDSLGYGNTSANSRTFEPLVETANRLGYTLYPVDLNNDLRNHYGSAEFGSIYQASYQRRLQDDRDWLEEDALIYLAAATGGRAYLDGSALTALENTAEDTRSYYSLGFTPAWQGDDGKHRVDVKVLKKGLKVRTRTSFSDLSRQTQNTMLVESAQLFDLPLPGGDLTVEFGQPSSDGFKKVQLPIYLEIPLDQITLLATGSGFSAQLELRVAATDHSGAQAPISVMPVEIHGNAPPTSQGTAAFETRLRLRKKPHRLLISVFDPVSGNTMSKRVEVSL